VTLYSLDRAEEAVRRFAGIDLFATVRTGRTTGLVLSVRPDSPGVLGVGVVDAAGEYAALGLSVEEASALRAALDRFLTEAG
jgi:hypothetical protein